MFAANAHSVFDLNLNLNLSQRQHGNGHRDQVTGGKVNRYKEVAIARAKSFHPLLLRAIESTTKAAPRRGGGGTVIRAALSCDGRDARPTFVAGGAVKISANSRGYRPEGVPDAHRREMKMK